MACVGHLLKGLSRYAEANVRHATLAWCRFAGSLPQAREIGRKNGVELAFVARQHPERPPHCLPTEAIGDALDGPMSDIALRATEPDSMPVGQVFPQQSAEPQEPSGVRGVGFALHRRGVTT
jgi:hypothetical protein